MKSIQFVQTTPEDFKNSIISDLESTLRNLAKQFIPKQQDELMTRKQVSEHLKISTVTLWTWTKEGRLTAYTISNRIYYKRHEVNQALIKL